MSKKDLITTKLIDRARKQNFSYEPPLAACELLDEMADRLQTLQDRIKELETLLKES